MIVTRRRPGSTRPAKRGVFGLGLLALALATAACGNCEGAPQQQGGGGSSNPSVNTEDVQMPFAPSRFARAHTTNQASDAGSD